MDEDDQMRQIQPEKTPPALLHYTLDQYIESPSLVKQTNEWLHSIYQHLAEKDKQLQRTEQELKHFKDECHRLRIVEKSLEEKTKELVERDKELLLTKSELKHLKAGSFRTSIIQHILSLLTAISFGIGINFATSTPSNAAGWILIFIGVATQSSSFYITYSEARKNA